MNKFIWQFLKYNLKTFIKSTRGDKNLYVTNDLNCENKKTYIYNWSIFDAGSFNMNVNFINKVNINKLTKDGVFNVSTETHKYLINQL